MNSLKEFKDYLSDDGIGYAFFVIVNIVVFNFRIEEPTMLSRILISAFMLIAYIIALIIIVNFIEKEFKFMYKMTPDLKADYIDKRSAFGSDASENMGSKAGLINDLKTKLMRNFTVYLLVIDLVSIIFYRNSVILELFAFIVKYFLGQAQMAG